ncbi:TRAP transporter TatT component family protein [sulfur-oxidizing endosymbiont of Gigantopelta aegis]|uniref:TRAP transporter TatT component family protein n=1 Tax=sulfur-oxidizing endosymbiont of Gigantopelta aegis TaxID=2794934 RepID=UPI0018DE936F|nr:TRAP transporter TatT component family protein [sulfur-oxidizing endosymbiont of Gigantopelta aegis]
MLSSTANKLASNLSYTILNSDDPQTVADGAPAYLLLMDSFLLESNNNPKLLQSAASLYSAYAGVFVNSETRAAKMTDKALNYALEALCIENKKNCHIRKLHYHDFAQQAATINKTNLNSWYVLGSTWAGWIKANSSNMSAIAELPKVTLIMEKIIAIDEDWQDGQTHLYLGVLKTLLPPALGGKPEQSQAHFKKVINLSQGKNLMAKVLYAEKYARLLFEQALHDRLLNEVIAADPYAENLTLMNVLAQKKAHELLATSNEYF